MEKKNYKHETEAENAHGLAVAAILPPHPSTLEMCTNLFVLNLLDYYLYGAGARASLRFTSPP